MVTAYNLRNAKERGAEAGRAALVDPGAGGTVRIGIADDTVLILSSAGTRTLQSPTLLATGNSILVTSSVAAVIISASSVSYTINAGEWIIFHVTRSSANVRQWSVKSSAAIVGQTAAKVVDIPQTAWRKGTDIAVAMTATSTTTAFAIINGTRGTDFPYIRTNPATGTVTQAALATIPVPADYQAGSALSLRFQWTATTPATETAVLFPAVYRASAPTVNLYGGAGVSCNATGTVDAVLTVTSIVPGETLLIYWEVALASSAASPDIRFGATSLVYTV